jgi:hypothetical protein
MLVFWSTPSALPFIFPTLRRPMSCPAFAPQTFVVGPRPESVGEVESATSLLAALCPMIYLVLHLRRRALSYKVLGSMTMSFKDF